MEVMEHARGATLGILSERSSLKILSKRFQVVPAQQNQVNHWGTGETANVSGGTGGKNERGSSPEDTDHGSIDKFRLLEQPRCGELH